VQGLAVVARAKPHHKYLLVDGLIKLNNVVAVTGDGTNDAPALIRADVGFAMGITGTQIAKNASDIIILDDRFDSIVQALVWGRNIYECVKKFLQFQLTVSFVAVILSVISSALIRQSVLSAVQMLWVNLIMDSLASLALATEPPDREELLKQKPNNRDDFLLTPTMMKHIAGQTIFQVSVLMFLLFAGPIFLPEYPDEFDDIIGTDLEAKYYQGQPEGTMVSGQLFHLDGSDNYQPFY
jgi:Ca2+ transporting ATPase